MWLSRELLPTPLHRETKGQTPVEASLSPVQRCKQKEPHQPFTKSIAQMLFMFPCHHEWFLSQTAHIARNGHAASHHICSWLTRSSPPAFLITYRPSQQNASLFICGPGRLQEHRGRDSKLDLTLTFSLTSLYNPCDPLLDRSFSGIVYLLLPWISASPVKSVPLLMSIPCSLCLSHPPLSSLPSAYQHINCKNLIFWCLGLSCPAEQPQQFVLQFVFLLILK